MPQVVLIGNGTVAKRQPSRRNGVDWRHQVLEIKYFSAGEAACSHPEPKPESATHFRFGDFKWKITRKFILLNATTRKLLHKRVRARFGAMQPAEQTRHERGFPSNIVAFHPFSNFSWQIRFMENFPWNPCC